MSRARQLSVRLEPGIRVQERIYPSDNATNRVKNRKKVDSETETANPDG
jgi:hypothetical protein